MLSTGFTEKSIGKARGYATERGRHIAPMLTAQWNARYRAAIEEKHVPAALDALMDHAVLTGALYERTTGMRVVPLGAHKLEAVFIPHRRAPGPEGAHVPGACRCPFCAPPNPHAKAVSWRGWDLLPNAFPYARLHSQHFLAVSREHRLQQFSPCILEDMLDLHALVDGCSRTFHYNGFAGNSQPHLHWQITKERLPIERAIAESATPLTTAHDGAVKAFDDGTLSGIVVEGGKSFIVRQTTALIEALKKDPVTRDRYNLLILSGPTSRVVIIPRRADALEVDAGDGKHGALSALEVAGRFVFSSRDDVPEGFTAASFAAAVRATTVPPSELAWLKDVVHVPRDARLRLHATRTDAAR